MSIENQTFEQFWSDVLDYCDEVNITAQYAEDEFILEVSYTVCLSNLKTLSLENHFEEPRTTGSR